MSPLVGQGETPAHEGERGHQRDEQDTITHEHTMQLGRRASTIAGIGQVIERAEADDGVEAAVGPGPEVAGIGVDDRLHPVAHTRFVDALAGDRQQLG